MRERVVIRSESELWDVVGRVGGGRVAPLDRLTLERGLVILSDLGLEPSWRDDRAAMARIVAETKMMKLGASRLSEILGAKLGTLKKVLYTRGRCPCFDLAVRWAAALEERCEMSPDGPQGLVLEVHLAIPGGLESGQSIIVAPDEGQERGQGSTTAPEGGPDGGQERRQETPIAQSGRQRRATAHEAEDGPEGPNSAKSDSKKVVDTSPLSAQGSSLMAILEWRLGSEMRLRVECRREDVAQRIEAERRAGTKGQIYIDNQLFDDRDMRLADIEERLAVQTELLTKLCKMLDGQGKPDAANPGHEQLAELLRRAEELSTSRGFPWAREFMRSFVEANKEEE